MRLKEGKEAAEFILNFEPRIAVEALNQLPTRIGKENTYAVIEALLKQPELDKDIVKTANELKELIERSRPKTITAAESEKITIKVALQEILNKHMAPPEIAAFLNLFSSEVSEKIIEELLAKLTKEKGKNEAEKIVYKICEDICASPVVDNSLRAVASSLINRIGKISNQKPVTRNQMPEKKELGEEKIHYDRTKVVQKLVTEHSKMRGYSA